MFFVAVIYSFFAESSPIALLYHYISLTRSKYGVIIFITFRKVEKLPIKLQKCKCDLDFIRLFIIYNLTPGIHYDKLVGKEDEENSTNNNLNNLSEKGI